MADAGPASQDSESLRRRLAGAVNKAGLAKDQSEINRIIHEVSKGSKFYENEKRKDKELTERIEKLMRIKDDLLREADLGRVEHGADRLFNELETERDLSQIIVHIDMDAFYASVELLSNPDLKDKPFGVGKGIITTASYEARKYGVRSGMAGFVAKKLCPELIFLPIDFKKYTDMSARVMGIFRNYDPNMDVSGCDEAYLNITNYCKEHNISAEDCVQQMRARVTEETSLTVSAGIAPNKMLAKIFSDKNKPDGQFKIAFDRESILAFMHDLPIRKVPGVGKVNERLLESIGVKTCGDIRTQQAVIWLMDHYFGKYFLFRVHLGIASSVVQPYRREERRSVGVERSFSPIEDPHKMFEKLDYIATELEKDMKQQGWTGKTVTLIFKLDTFQSFTRARSVDRWVSSKKELLAIGKELLVPELPLCVRLLGLRVTKLRDLRSFDDRGIKRFFQGNFTSPQKKRKLEEEEEEEEETIKRIDGRKSLDVDAMPGYYEHENTKDDEIQQQQLLDELGHDESEHLSGDESSKDALLSKAASSSRVTLETTRRSGRVSPPISANHRDPPPDPGPSKLADKPSQDSEQCPVCAKELDVEDNQALNAHLDYCLSKETILSLQSGPAPTTLPGILRPSKVGKLPSKRRTRRK